MDAGTQGQVTRSAAEIYEEFFVPALFAEWAPRVADAAAIGPGDHVLDVACGTGVLAREAASRVGARGRVVGLDRNEWMFEVARRVAPDIDWVPGLAEALPFAKGEFDVVVSQFGLMFFDDRMTALREMWRVLRPGGRMVVAVWDAAERAPGYATLIALIERLFSEAAANALRAPFSLGDPADLSRLALAAGISDARLETVMGTARFPSIESWVYTDVKGWTLADMIDDAQLTTLQREAQQELARFRQPDGTVAFVAPAHILTATK
jgi:ubiquinone/menaquinone biosynthesis C-methylase UbiE